MLLDTLKRLLLGLTLIALAAAVLLYADRGSRRSSREKSEQPGAAERVFQVALVQCASIPALEEGVIGIVEALAERGYLDGGRIQLKRYNAEGDIGTANAIAKEVTSGPYDLIISASTVSLQTIANANKFGRRTPHVFGLVTDPYNAGVGIEATNHAIHPPYLTGYGSFQPVEKIFKTAREMRPELKTVGLVWNPAEANSVAQTKLAQTVCAGLGIELIEANAENSTAAREAVHSLISRGVEAVWISGDVTVAVASEVIIEACRRAAIPAFTAMPPNILRGALFDLGANYVEIGRSVGRLAADVLDGKDPADIPVENFVPEMLMVNETVPASLKERWVIAPETRRHASGWISATETNLPKASATGPQPKPGRVYKIALAYFAPEAGAETCMRGIFDGLRDLGFVEGKNLEVRRSHAQAEIVNIPSMLQNFDSSDVDAIVPMSTPVISSACAFVKHKPVVFTYCSDPIAAGAGNSFTDHLPHMTGIGSFPPVQDMVDVIRQTLPKAKAVGTIYNASEANSVKVIEVARGLFTKAGLKLDEVTVASPSEVLQAGQALASRRVDALYIQGDNTVIQGFDAVVKATRDAKVPLFVDDPECAKRGALACVGLGFYRPGYAMARPLARVLTGESPAGIPMENVSEKAVWLDPALAQKLGVKFPDSLVKEVERSSKPAAKTGPLARKVKIDLIESSETPNVDANRAGILDGFTKAGLKRGQDFELRIRNAQGDLATLTTMVDAATSEGVDLLLTSTTPALQAALRRAGNRPIIFSLVANPVMAGAGKSDTDHLAMVTGAYISAPHDLAMAALRQCMPRVKRIGTLFVPSEVNSIFYKDDLVKAATQAGIAVETVGVSTSSEVPDAAMALCGLKVDAICQISDNLNGASFASIVQAARRARLPLLSFASEQTKAGSFMTVSRDYYYGGVAAAEIAARVLRGEKPANIPFYLVPQLKYCFNPDAAARVGITIPPGLLSQGEIVK